jgi:hypothetical protein
VSAGVAVGVIVAVAVIVGGIGVTVEVTGTAVVAGTPHADNNRMINMTLVSRIRNMEGFMISS